MAPDETFLRGFYRALNPALPADPAGEAYERLYDEPALASSDPVRELATAIDWAVTQSTQLFSGFRGTGKSTELRRLKALLEEDPDTVVVLCDMQEFLNLSTPVDVSDFLLAMSFAFGDELGRHPVMGGAAVLGEGYWDRFTAWLKRTHVELADIGGAVGGAVEFKLNLRQDPTFRQKLQSSLAGHIGPLARDTHQFFEACYQAVQARRGGEPRLVLLLDSVEQIRGGVSNEAAVAASVATLFQGHADKLRIPHIHVVYTVPPWLKIRAPGAAALYDGYQQIPCVKVRTRDGQPHPPGLDALERVVRRRGTWERLLGSREALDRVSLASGGYLRDLFRILQAVLRLTRGKPLPAPAAVVDLALAEIRNSYLPLSHADADWLARVDANRNAGLPDGDQLPDLARYFDNLLVMTYRNGDEWFGVHPLVVDHARAQRANADGASTG